MPEPVATNRAKPEDPAWSLDLGTYLVFGFWFLVF
jgi:hypothetical protein